MIAVALLMIMSSNRQSTETNASAVVEQREGFYIFHMSKPVRPYTYLGTEKKGIAWNGTPEEMLDAAIKKIRRNYPTADGIIFTTTGMSQAEAIKFDK